MWLPVAIAAGADNRVRYEDLFKVEGLTEATEIVVSSALVKSENVSGAYIVS